MKHNALSVPNALYLGETKNYNLDAALVNEMVSSLKRDYEHWFLVYHFQDGDSAQSYKFVIILGGKSVNVFFDARPKSRLDIQSAKAVQGKLPYLVRLRKCFYDGFAMAQVVEIVA